MSNSFCAVPLPNLVCAGPRTREEFDRLELPETVHEWSPDKVRTLIQNDGQEWERRCYSKAFGDYRKNGVMVVFQWFDYRPVAADGAV